MPSIVSTILSMAYIPVIVGMWIGLVGLGRSGKSGSWWCMLAGTVLESLTIVKIGAYMVSRFYPDVMESFATEQVYYAAWGIQALGSLLFAAGFALYGWQSRGKADRVTELEAMNLAQAAELERLRRR